MSGPLPFKTRSDTLKLRRLIEVLRERGSDLAEDLERKAHNFLTDVQVKINRTVIPETFESDEEFSSFVEGGGEESDDESPELFLDPSPPTPPPPPPPPVLVREATPPPPPPPPPQVKKEPTPPPQEKSCADLKKEVPNQPLPNRQQIRTLSKDTPSLAADKPKLTPDCKLYWIQKHLEQEQERDEEEKRRIQEETRRRLEEDARRRMEEEEERRRLQEERQKEEEHKLKQEEERRKKEEEEARKKEEKRRKEEEAKREKEDRERKKKENEEILMIEKEAQCEEEQKQKQIMESKKEEEKVLGLETKNKEEEEERRLLEENQDTSRKDSQKKTEEEQKKHLKLTSERSRKPTLAREWRKLNQKKKSRVETEADKKKEKVEVEPDQEEEQPVIRKKYIPPVYAENELYQDRLGSFQSGWPHTNKKGVATPSELAEAGFFLVGPGDLCKCFQCALELMCWEPFESPWIRHGFLSTECSYVERIKGADWMNKVKRGDF